jgi:hypothetical protein
MILRKIVYIFVTNKLKLLLKLFTYMKPHSVIKFRKKSFESIYKNISNNIDKLRWEIISMNNI